MADLQDDGGGSSSSSRQARSAGRRRGRPPALPYAFLQSERYAKRLLPIQFKAALYAKGWKLKEAAALWDLTPEWLSRMAGTESRPLYLDHAVRGLPRRGRPIPLPPSWLRALKEGQADAQRKAKVKKPGFEFEGWLRVGTVLVVSRHLGEEIDEGMRGLVLGVERTSGGECYHVIFESGAVECFDSKGVEDYLAETGLEVPGLFSYRYRSVEQARADFDRGGFDFYG